MRKEIERQYTVKIYESGDLIQQVDLAPGQTQILVHKFDNTKHSVEDVLKMHQSLQECNPGVRVLSFPHTSEISIYEIIEEW